MTNFHFVYVYLVTFIKVYTNSVFAHFEHQFDQCGFEWPPRINMAVRILRNAVRAQLWVQSRHIDRPCEHVMLLKGHFNMIHIYFVMKGRTLQKLQLKDWWNCVMKYLKEIVISLFFSFRAALDILEWIHSFNHPILLKMEF